MIKRILLLFIFASFLTNCFAGTTDPDKSDSEYVKYGQQFHYVGKLQGKDQNQNLFIGSCVAYSNNIVLTAAHMMHDAGESFVVINNKTIKIDKVIIHPLFKENGKEYDIAICRLENSIDLDFFPDLYSDTDEVGKLCCISGYGVTGKFNSTTRYADDKRRAGSNTIDMIEDGGLVCSVSISNKTQLEFITASGDSGGGLFIGNKLAGINSAISRVFIDKVLQNDYRTTSYHVRISKHIEWIKKSIMEVAEK